MPYFTLAGPAHNVEIFGIRLLGVDALNGRKLLFTAAFFVVLYLISKALRALSHLATGNVGKRTAFWSRQGVSHIPFMLGVLGFVSIWFDNPARLATGFGLLGAGLAFALQKVITSFAGYFVILRGKTFNVGDRITIGGVRGDVIALNFIQTVIMEMRAAQRAGFRPRSVGPIQAILRPDCHRNELWESLNPSILVCRVGRSDKGPLVPRVVFERTQTISFNEIRGSHPLPGRSPFRFPFRYWTCLSCNRLSRYRPGAASWLASTAWL